MLLTPLTSEEIRQGFTHSVTITHADLTETAANTAQTIAILTVPVGSRVAEVATRLVTPFAKSSDSALNTTTLKVGDGNDDDRFLVSQELNVNGSYVSYKTSPIGSSATAPYVYTTADTVDAVFGSMAAKTLESLDTGEVHILLRVTDLSKF